MVNDNIIRSEKVKNLDHILIINNSNSQNYFKGSDVADFQVQVYESLVKLIILTTAGYTNSFYNVPFNIVYKNQDHIEESEIKIKYI